MSKFKVGDIVKVKYDAKYRTVFDLTDWFKQPLERDCEQKIFGIRKINKEICYEIDYQSYEGSNYIIVQESSIIGKVYTITSQDAVNIINIACSGWKQKLAEKWGANIVLQKNIEVDDGFIKEMFKAANEGQQKILIEIFPHKASKDLDEIKGELQHFSTNREKNDAMIQVRQVGNLENQGYWLNPMFNWELVLDNSGIAVLVPKNKLR
jgi:hypothetical protein